MTWVCKGAQELAKIAPPAKAEAIGTTKYIA